MATRTLTTWLGTWNLNGKPIVVPDGAARQWIVDDADADLYVFGLQELPALAVTSLLAESGPSDQYSSLIAPVLQGNLPAGYSRLICNEFGAMAIDVYVRDSIRDEIRELATRVYGVGPLAGLGQKGAISVRFAFRGQTFCFVSCHLAANEGARDIRDKQFSDAFEQTSFASPNGSAVPISAHDHCFVLGDLNYRLLTTRGAVLRVASGDSPVAKLLEADELLLTTRSGPLSKGFVEPEVTFLPTYKFADGQFVVDRVPSYCDRVLYRPRAGSLSTPAECRRYSSVPLFCCSDHKPVFAVYTCTVEEGTGQADGPADWPPEQRNRAVRSAVQYAGAVWGRTTSTWTYLTGQGGSSSSTPPPSSGSLYEL
ncbi:unnamed protein product (mitochondrion) [Plasmodiophora brassicae]|uniref:Inositol polyphosphate-related phosphatase domain-containing protein n=1 Tax=Plasmodiophora brassicae TaxID=37360 RepID=A0A0G4IVN9_PLABS|nr:hypothetical protein PBRA_001036 [Plasmodiophora brassicae]SPQ97149.1 unnamed protein product [Plasmodiophora brassicae]